MKSRREVPRPCSSRSGSPEPLRVRDSGAVSRLESSIVLLERSGGTSVRGSCAVVGATPLARAIGRWIDALSRCAIPHKVVTTNRMAKSHNIIRSSACSSHGRHAWQGVGGLALFIDRGRGSDARGA